jgi:hypothetical protein
MITIPEDQLHRLKQLRDDLEWFDDMVSEQIYVNQPWRHYTTTIRSTRSVVGSVIRNSEAVTA